MKPSSRALAHTAQSADPGLIIVMYSIIIVTGSPHCRNVLSALLSEK